MKINIELGYYAAVSLESAIQREIKLIESVLERDVPQVPHAKEYFLQQKKEAKEAIDQLQTLSKNVGKIKWSHIVKDKA